MVYESIKLRMFRAARAHDWDAKQLRDLYQRCRPAAMGMAISLTEEAFAGLHPPARECGYYIDGNRMVCLRNSGNPDHNGPMHVAYVAQFVLEDICGMGIIPVPGVKYGPDDPRSRPRKEVA